MRQNKFIASVYLVVFLVIFSCVALADSYGLPDDTVRGPPSGTQIGPPDDIVMGPPQGTQMGPPENIPTGPSFEMPDNIPTDVQNFRNMGPMPAPEQWNSGQEQISPLPENFMRQGGNAENTPLVFIEGEFVGPGNCKTPDECTAYCAEKTDECQQFLKEHFNDDKIRRQRIDQRRPPAACPEKIKEAGLCRDFIEVMCTGMKLGMRKNLLDRMQLTIQYFDNLSADKQIAIDTSNLKSILGSVEPKLNQLCNADENNFGGIASLVVDSFGQNAMNNAFTQPIENVKQGYLPKMEAKVAEIQELKKSIGPLQEQMKAASSSGPSSPSISNINSIEQQMKSVIAKLTALGNEVSAMGEEMESVLGGVEAYVNSEIAKKDYSSLKQEYVDMQLRLTKKMQEYHQQELLSSIQRLEQLGFDASALKTISLEIEEENAKSEECIKSLDFETQEPEACFASLEQKEAGWQELADTSIKSQIETKYLSTLERVLPKIKEGIASAKEKGIDTSEIEGTMAKLETVIDLGDTIGKNPKTRGEALDMLNDLQALVKKLKEDWISLKEKLGEGGSDE